MICLRISFWSGIEAKILTSLLKNNDYAKRDWYNPWSNGVHLYIGSYVLVVSNGKLCRIHFNDMFSSYFAKFTALLMSKKC